MKFDNRYLKIYNQAVSLAQSSVKSGSLVISSKSKSVQKASCQNTQTKIRKNSESDDYDIRPFTHSLDKPQDFTNLGFPYQLTPSEPPL